MDPITPEEIAAGSQPTRAEKIMYTPLEEVLAKDSWDDIDLEILVNNRHALDEETLTKLGITKPVALAPEAVQAATEALGPVPTEEKVEEAPIVEVVTEDTVVGDTVDNDEELPA